MSDRLELNTNQRMILGQAIAKLGEAVGQPFRDNFVSDVTRAQNYCQQVLGDIVPAPKLSEKDAELSSKLHTYLRKYADGPLSVILYRMIAEDRGKAVWYAFVKGLNANSFILGNAIQCAQQQADENRSTDDTILVMALQLWDKQEFKDMIEEIKSW